MGVERKGGLKDCAGEAVALGRAPTKALRGTSHSRIKASRITIDYNTTMASRSTTRAESDALFGSVYA